MKHVHGIFPVLHPETELKTGIGPDVAIDGSARSLCGKNQMNAKASSDLSYGNQLPHEIWKLLLHLSELVDDNQKVR